MRDLSFEVICPSCRTANLSFCDSSYFCTSCRESFPIVNDVPILLSDSNEFFNKQTSVDPTSSGFSQSLIKLFSSFVPSQTLIRNQDNAFYRFLDILPDKSSCLVIGSGDDFRTIELLKSKGVKAITSDVFYSSSVDFVFDAESIPFADSSFNSIVCIAVLEHVLEPKKVVSEFSRVLVDGGVVFSSIPFLQHVHMGRFDFQRYSFLGHRWLFKQFDEIEMGSCSGAGSALVWSLTGFFQSFSNKRYYRYFAKLFFRFFFFWLKYLDYIPQSSDFALGTYFIGRNRKVDTLTRTELLKRYDQSS